jgi:hypothetical protein
VERDDRRQEEEEGEEEEQGNAEEALQQLIDMGARPAGLSQEREFLLNV